jgi:hypothetical protein
VRGEGVLLMCVVGGVQGGLCVFEEEGAIGVGGILSSLYSTLMYPIATPV